MSDASGPEQVDLLITGATVVTMDTDRRILKGGGVAVKGDRIVAVGKDAELTAAYTAKETVDGSRFVLTPGFVNTHIHITGEPLTRGYMPEDISFEENIFGWLIPLYQAHTPDQEKLSAVFISTEMMRTGTTTFLEAGTIYHLDQVAEGLTEVGIRSRIGEFIQDRAFDPSQDQNELIDWAIRTLEGQLTKFPIKQGERVGAWANLVGHQTNTPEVWKAAKDLALQHGARISAHMSPVEMDPTWYLENTNRRPIEYLSDIEVLGPHLALTHCVHVDDNEVALLAETGTNVNHCPLAALKGAYGIPSATSRIPEMVASGVNVGLGTDGNNNGNASDLMRCIYLAAGLYKDSRQDVTQLSGYRALEMATIGGAKTLGLEHEIGSLEPGKKADFVLHDIDRPEWRPLLNPVNQLVWSATGAGVHSVWVDGRQTVANHRCVTVDEEELYRQVDAAAVDIIARSGLPDRQAWPVA